ncbi:DUF3450 domain-containing protein [Desulfospira joergensenii]|uniref:DUF3450 domain-containing protein n=1 Tax=Desulfospira joergensenii TaxID=53329 RepID=UPI0003B491FB|nr:DUF3450 domain-containing protein [Desulfospira joergensenii]
MKYLFTYLALSVFFLLGNPSNGPSQTDVETRIEKPVEKAIRIQQETQKSESKWRNDKEKKIALFESLEKQIEALEAEKAGLIKINLGLHSRIDAKKKQLSDMEQISAQILPFLDQVLDRIRQVKAGDIPFLDKERQNRIQALESMMADPEVPVSEKFRKITEGLLVETEYGQTVEAYQQTVDLEGEPTLVNIFRLGRLNLFYQTLDKQGCGFFHTAQKAWIPLADTFLRDIQAAIDMGAKRKPVEMLNLPLGRIVVK